jgi:hypothetical protein
MKEREISLAWIKCPRAAAAVAAILGIHAALLARIAAGSSPTVDEVAHLPAGLAVVKYGRFDLYRVNPPLVKALAALPVALSGAQEDWAGFNKIGRPEWGIGRRFIAANGRKAFWYFTLARWACIPLSLFGGWVCYRWASDLYGEASGVLAASLWCASPNVLAYGSLITPDVGASVLGVAASYLFWRWLSRPGWGRAVAAGTALGAAELTKMTWLILFPLWPVLWLILPPASAAPRLERMRQAVQMAAILLLALYVLNLGYGFEGTFRRLGDYSFVSGTLGAPGGGNRFAAHWLGSLPVPFPEPYVSGLDLQRLDLEGGLWSYLRGTFRRGGWWYFYLYALAIKEPLGTWALLALAAAAGLRDRRYSAGRREEFLLLVPAIAVLALVSSQTGLSRYLRYVLPSFPFAFIWTSKVARSVPLGDRAIAAAMGASLAWSVGSSLSIYPHSLSYFNELAGGPTGGHYHLIDASIDWGQDLLALKAWADRHPEARPFHVDLFGTVDPASVGIAADPFPQGPRPGWYAMSVHRLHEVPRDRPFLRLRPAAMIGYSIYVYHLSEEDARRIGREDRDLNTWGAVP